jgi:hypothetical protein
MQGPRKWGGGVHRGAESTRVRERRSGKFLKSGEIFARLTGKPSSSCLF